MTPGIRFLHLMVIICLGAFPEFARAANSEQGVPVEKIIEQFIDKETEFSRAMESYTYRQTVKILELNNSGGVRGRYESIQDILFGRDGKRVERVVYAPVPTLQQIIMTQSDLEDIRGIQPFVMTRDTAADYRIDYLGEQKVDEIDSYMFSLKPKSPRKGQRYFEGQIWVDKVDLQIVKTYGKGVGLITKQNKGERFPRFETYRDQIDGKYWFPVYTIANDTLNFDSGPQRMKMIVKYEDYKRFRGTSVITFGDIVEGDSEEQDGER